MTTSHQEFEFSLIVGGVSSLSDSVETALYESGCDDATISWQYGVLYMEFARQAASLKDAILSAIRDVKKANIGATVLRVDDCNMVTQAEIARRMGRTRQLVLQYVNGQRGPGGFPAPICNIVDGTPLWQWCAVSHWLAANDMIRPEMLEQAEVICTINNTLDMAFSRSNHPALVNEIEAVVAGA